MVDDASTSSEEAPSLVNPLQLMLNALEESPMGLKNIPIKVKEREAIAMVDMGASHNIVSERVAKNLGLKLSKSLIKIKVVNFETKPIAGVAQKVSVRVGDWLRKVEFLVVPLDDFDIIENRFPSPSEGSNDSILRGTAPCG